MKITAGRFAIFTRLSLVAAFALAFTFSAAARPDGKIEGAEWRCTLMVNPLRGDVKTTRSGGGWGDNRYGNNFNNRSYSSNSSYNQSQTKSITRNLKWAATVRCRGKERPEKLELKVDYIAHKGNDMTYYVLKSETMAVTLDKGGKANLELESPSTTITRTRSSTVSSGSSYSSGFQSVRSKTSGEQVDGCIVRLYAEGQLIREWMSNPGFSKLAKAQ